MGNYHDYVIRNGNLVGEFDEMYKNCSDPWMQSDRAGQLEIKILFSLINSCSYDSILELGCGHGHIAHKLASYGNVLGVDLSNTAIKKARELYPNIAFDEGNILEGIASRKNAGKDQFNQFNLIVLSGTLWYVIEEIDLVFTDIDKHLLDDGEFIISLPFPDITESFYGKELVPNEKYLEGYVQKYFQILDSVIIKNGNNMNRPIVIIRAKKK